MDKKGENKNKQTKKRFGEKFDLKAEVSYAYTVKRTKHDQSVETDKKKKKKRGVLTNFSISKLGCLIINLEITRKRLLIVAPRRPRPARSTTTVLLETWLR